MQSLDPVLPTDAQPVDPIHYQVLKSIAIDGYWRIDLTGKLVEVNDACCVISGYTREELLSMRVEDLDALETGDIARERIQRIVENGSERFVTRHRRKDGELLDIEVNCAFVPVENGYVIGFLRDITRRTRAELAREQARRDLIQSEERFRRLVESMHDMVFTTDAQGHTTGVYGGHPASILPPVGPSAAAVGSELFSPDALRIYEAAHRRALEGEHVTYTWQYAADGRSSFIQTSLSPLRDPDSSAIVGVVGVGRDITDIKEAEERLLLRDAIIEAAANAIAVVDRHGNIETVNRAFCQLTGYTAHEVIGQPIGLRRPDAYDAEQGRGVAATINAGDVWRGEFLSRRKDGSTYFSETTITPVRGPSGEVEHFIAIEQDVTERKRAEAMLIEERALLAERVAQRTAELSTANAQLATREAALERVVDIQRAILENAGQMIVATDVNGVIQLFNAEAERLLGYSARDVIGGASPILFHVASDLTGPSTDMERGAGIVVRPELMGRLSEWTLERKDGSRFPAMVVVTPLRNADGEITGYVGVGSDISAIKQVEDNLRRSEATLQTANDELARTLRIRDEFLASMSHELRTPLAAILSLSEGLSDEVAGPLNERQRKYVATITESGQHLLALINDVLDLSKIEAGRLQLELEPVDVDLVCHASMRLVKEQAQRKGLTGSLRIDADVQTLVADERRLKQILVNLLTNAVKFTPDGGSYGLEVRSDHAGHQVSFCVWDTGVGIDPTYMPFLFQPFVQIDNRLSRKHAGTGLGLALVRRMAELHGGRVEVKSTPSRGARFVVTLPWEEEPANEGLDLVRAGGQPALAGGLAYAVPPVAAQRNFVPSPLTHSTILLVEDNESAAMAVHDYLVSRGCTVLKARSGAEALQIALAVRPDLILMDVQMPDMDGIETTRRLRQYPHMQSVVIIALTALAMRDDRERCLAAGMNDYMAKPVEFRKLAQLIEKHLTP